MKFFSQDLLSSIISTGSITARLSIDAYYLNSQGIKQTDGITVTLVADGYTQVDNYMDVPIGTEVTYTVTKQDYNTIGPIAVTVVGDSTIDAKINALPLWTYNIMSVPGDSTKSMTSGVYTSNTGSLTLPQNHVISWAVAHASMNSLSGTMGYQEGDPTTITETKILSSTLTLLGVTPSDALVTWTTGTGDVSHELSVTALCTNSVGLTITKAGYTPYPDAIVYPGSVASYPTSEQGEYLLNTEIQAITLQKKPLVCSLSCNLPDAVVRLWKEENGVEVSGSRVSSSGSCSINCVMDDEIHWSVEKSGYYTQTGYTIMGTEDKTLPPVTLILSEYVVTITSNPSEATVRILSGQTVLASGTGGVSVGVNSGTVITYDASLGGVTATGTATINADYSDELVLDAATAVTLVTSTTSAVILPYGKYKCVLVGGGAGGHTTDTQATSATRAANASPGSGGGGSGYAIIDTFTVTNLNGEAASFTVGNGGAADSDGGATTIVIGSKTITAGGGKTGYSSSYNYGTYYRFGGNGGSGGGVGGYGGNRSSANYNASGNPTQGALGGGNAQSVTNFVNNVFSGGVGYYNTTKSYENNAGTTQQTVTAGTPGGAGRGLESISTTLRTASYFLSLTDVQNLYNSLGGGGGGGATGVPAINSSIPTVYGGGGGGGGGWNAGSAGSGRTGGAGGKGAILYMRVAWS